MKRIYTVNVPFSIKWILLGILCILILVFAGCNLITTSPSTSKVSVPLVVDLTISEPKLTVGQRLSLTLTFTPGEKAQIVKGIVTTSGIITLFEPHELVWSNLEVGEQQTAEFKFRIDQPGEGEVKATVQVSDTSGKVLYGRAVVLYFLATQDEVLVNKTSPFLLRLEKLDRDLQSGRITRAQYEKQREQILGGGATETSSMSSPSPTATP